MIKVVNKKCLLGMKKVENEFFIGRPSPLGNPYKISKNVNREEAIKKYRAWLWDRIKKKDEKVVSELRKIKQAAIDGNVYLICYCSPLPCHGDVIKSCVEWCISKSGK